MNKSDVYIPFAIMLGLTAGYALIWTVFVQKVNPFKPVDVESVLSIPLLMKKWKEANLSHYVTSPKPSLWERIGKLTQQRLPAGYQTGLTLNRVEKDMAPYPCEWEHPECSLYSLSLS